MGTYKEFYQVNRNTIFKGFYHMNKTTFYNEFYQINKKQTFYKELYQRTNVALSLCATKKPISFPAMGMVTKRSTFGDPGAQSSLISGCDMVMLTRSRFFSKNWKRSMKYSNLVCYKEKCSFNSYTV